MTKKSRESLIALVYLPVGLIAISSASVMIKLAQEEGVESAPLAMYRMLIASILITLTALSRKSCHAIQELKWKEFGLIFLSGFCLAMHFASWITSLEYTTILNSTIFVTTTPLWIALINPFTLKEPLSKSIVLGLIAAFFGSLMIASSSQNTFTLQFNIGDLLALLGGVMAAVYLIIGRSLRSRLPLDCYLSLVYTSSFIFLLFWALTQSSQLSGYSVAGWNWIILIGLIPQLIGHSLTNLALRNFSASFIAISWLSEPMGATLLGIIFLREIPSYFQIIGGIVILAGIILASFDETKNKEQ